MSERENNNDAIADRSSIGREVRGDQESFARLAHRPVRDCHQRSQEEWRIRPAWHRATGACGSQGAHGTKPGHGRGHKIAAKKVVKFRIAKAAKDAIVPPKKAKG